MQVHVIRDGQIESPTITYDGFTCPVCGSTETEWKDPEVAVSQDLVEQHGECWDCRSEFELVFRVEFLEITNERKDAE